MGRGSSEIPILRLEVLQKFLTKFTAPPELVLQNLFPSSPSPSSAVKWESQTGTRGMTPFVPPGSPAPKTSPLGIAQHSAEAAFWKEIMDFDEEFLNNLRGEGSEAGYMDAAARLSRELGQLVNRANRRKEWMFAKMIFEGSFDYYIASGVKIGLDYGIPSANQVTLATDYKWSTGTSRNIIGDIIDGKKLIADECGGRVDMAICNSQVLRYLAQDPDIQTLLQKSAFGQGDLFSGSKNPIVGVNPNVIAGLLDIPNLLIYDEVYEVKNLLTGVVTKSSTTAIPVTDTTDYEVGATLRLLDVSAGSYEDATIASIQTEAGTVTIDAVTAASFMAGEDYAVQKKKFISDTMFVMIASTVEGVKIAEYKSAPYGVPRKYGLSTDRNDKWDPEVVQIRVQDKGLPILYHTDAIYQLTVA
jgi:hypothetical protein